MDFPAIAAQSQAALTTSMQGAAVGDAVLVASAADVAGVFFTAAVTAPNVVTVYAKNFTAAPINPPSTAFRITVIKG
ncbi:hypothetical protein [Cupriavidus sp. D384]|uniref:hypothetical protein n=1 Tax=Cupriavidus sp. D384 TaxID=1538095 RepID=UPI0012E79760|nr:hypothetical protein [Cupriavidus sp. D384]